MVRLSEQSVVPYRVLSDAALLRIGQTLQNIIAHWTAQLFGDSYSDTGISVEASGADSHSTISNSYVVTASDSPLAQISLPAETLPRLLSVPVEFREHRGIESAASLVDRLQVDLLSALAAKIMEGAAVTEWSLERGTEMKCPRSVWFQVDFGENRNAMRLQLSPIVIDKLCPPPAPAAVGQGVGHSRLAAIADSVVDLEVRLGESQIDLADFTTLAVGNVLVVDSSLQDLCDVYGGGGKRIGSARLGQSDGKRSIKIADTNTT